MARFVFLIPSTCGNAQMEKLFRYFIKLASPYARIEVKHFGEEKLHGASDVMVEKALVKESIKIKKHLLDDDKVFLLSEKGEVASTEAWSREMSEWMPFSGRVVFILGSARGLHRSLLEDKKYRSLAIGEMTLQHELALVVWSEQIYRLLTLQVGKRYHY
jgi:23S rRNA pseudoU1915 N3-methylase RlmH